MSRRRSSRPVRRRRALLAGTVSAGAVLAASGFAGSAAEAQSAAPQPINQYSGQASGAIGSASSTKPRDFEFVTAGEAEEVGLSALRQIGSGTVAQVVRGPHGGHLVTVHRGDGAVVTIVQDATQVSRSVRVDLPHSSP